MKLDPRTVILLMFISNLLMGGGLLAVSRGYLGQIPGVARWAKATLIMALGWLVSGILRGVLPDVVSIVLGNGLNMLALALYLQILAEFTGARLRADWMVGLILGLCSLLAYFTLVSPDLAVRVAAISACAAILLLKSSHLILRPRGSRPVSHSFTGGLFALCGAFMLVRVPYYLLVATDPNQAAHGQTAMNDIAFLIFFITSIGFTFGFVLMCNDRYFTERRSAQRALTEGERFLKTLIDSVPGRVAYWTRELRCRFANPAYCAWFGKTDLQMQSVRLHDLLGAELFVNNEPLIRAALEGQPQQFERTFTLADGLLHHVLVNYIPDASEGEVRGFLVVFTDVTAMKQTQLQLEELNAALTQRSEQAETATRAKTAFLSSMSHELRTPLNSVLGFAQLMALDKALPVDHQESVDQILQSGTHLLSLINDVLNLSKIEAGEASAVLEVVVVTELINECQSLIAPLASERGIEFDVPDIQLESLITDYRMLKQILINLLSNAVKYNRPGGRIRVSLSHQDAENICLSVSDTGIGIPDERLPELFQPFSRLGAEFTDIEGSGIGLAICQRLANVLHGKIEVLSQPGVGSEFRVVLDSTGSVNAGSAGTSPALPLNLNLPSPTKVLTGTILHIEDNPVNLRLMRQVLKIHPELLLVDADNAESGIELATAYQPDLILLDINLPGMDGYAALKALRAQFAKQDIPIVAVSANALPADIARAREAGFNDYLTKPYKISALMAIIEHFGSAS